jgi:hypothetical protein
MLEFLRFLSCLPALVSPESFEEPPAEIGPHYIPEG